MNSHRVASFVLLAGGLLLVFAGLASALDYSPAGMAASGAAIAALLYAGGVWFSAPQPPADSQVVLFTRTLTVASGASLGRPVADLFPGVNPPVIDQNCQQALDGRSTRFTAAGRTFAASPVRSPEGAVIYGLLLSGRAAEAAEAELTRAV